MSYDTFETYLTKDSRDIKQYTFTTGDGVDYFLIFSKATFLFKQYCEPCEKIFAFTFSPVGNRKPSRDVRIVNTILAVIKLFIEINNCPIVYVCDSTDHRELCRQRLFNGWWLRTEFKNNFKYGIRQIEFTDYLLILGIISKIDDPYHEHYFNQIDQSGHE